MCRQRLPEYGGEVMGFCRLRLAALALCLCITAGSPGPARADDAMPPQPGATQTAATGTNSAPPPGVDSAHQVIDRLMAALRDRRAEDAFALTSPDIRTKYEDAEDFLGSVRFEYRPLYNNLAYDFLDSTPLDDALIQRVSLKKRDGGNVTVIYRLERQPDGEWLVDSFSILDFDDAQPI